jgi:hypothetical protein
MGLFRICRPITVDARQSSEAGTIATDLGFIHVKRGDWIIRGEDNESYILNDEFFQRTFAPVKEEQLSREVRAAPDQAPAAENSKTSPYTVDSCVRGRRKHRADRAVAKRSFAAG